MTDTTTPLPSLADRVRPIAAGGGIVGVHFFGRTPVFVLGEEHLLFAPEQGEQRVAIHDGAILATPSDGIHILTGGDDGTLVATDARGEHAILATDDKRRWIDQVALGPDGALAWSAGKTAHVLTKKGEARSFEAPSTVAGLGGTADGDFLATSGSEQLILWPFDGKDGPMGRQPKIMARSKARVVVVACHPHQPVVAVGYADGEVLLARIDDGALIEVKAAGLAPVSALGWDAGGQTLAFGTESGEAGALSF